MRIGSIIVGEIAAASLVPEPGGYILNLVLPKAEPGEKGDRGWPGPIGPRGGAGRDGVSLPPTQTDLAFAIQEMLDKNPQRFRGLTGVGQPGSPGRDGKTPTEADILPVVKQVLAKHADYLKGERGEKGEPAYTRQEIIQIIIEAMTQAGVMDSNVKKLLAVRAKLKQTINHCDARNIAIVSDLVREVDKIFKE